MSEVNNKLEVNEDLAKERRKCNFDIQEMTFIIDGGEEYDCEKENRYFIYIIII